MDAILVRTRVGDGFKDIGGVAWQRARRDTFDLYESEAKG